MGKYMKKSKITGDVGVMEVSQPTSLGVRTRAAKTLALQRLNSSSSSSASAAPVASPDASAAAGSSSCYLQLRSRRLEKPPPLTEPKKQQQQQKCQRSEGGGVKGSGSRARLGSGNSGTAGSVSVSVAGSCDGDGCFDNYGDYSGHKGFSQTEEGDEAAAEASFGENNLDFEARDRSTRESTPCNFIRDPAAIRTPGSSTRQMGTTASNNRRGQDGAQRTVPTTRELEEFFVYAEQRQQRLFMEKYNFDFVNDLPLPGRYEWVQVVP